MQNDDSEVITFQADDESDIEDHKPPKRKAWQDSSIRVLDRVSYNTVCSMFTELNMSEFTGFIDNKDNMKILMPDIAWDNTTYKDDFWQRFHNRMLQINDVDLLKKIITVTANDDAKCKSNGLDYRDVSKDLLIVMGELTRAKRKWHSDGRTTKLIDINKISTVDGKSVVHCLAAENLMNPVNTKTILAFLTQAGDIPDISHLTEHSDEDPEIKNAVTIAIERNNAGFLDFYRIPNSIPGSVQHDRGEATFRNALTKTLKRVYAILNEVDNEFLENTAKHQ